MNDSSFNTLATSIGAPSEEALADGADPVVEIAYTIGIRLPFAGPDGDPIQVPSALHRYRFTREQALKFAQAVTDSAEQLPEENKSANLVIANNLSAVEQTAEQMTRMTGR